MRRIIAGPNVYLHGWRVLLQRRMGLTRVPLHSDVGVLDCKYIMFMSAYIEIWVKARPARVGNVYCTHESCKNYIPT